MISNVRFKNKHYFLTLCKLFLKIAIWPQLTLNVNLNLHAALKVFCQHHIMLLYFFAFDAENVGILQFQIIQYRI